jgi:hypothetical protein
MARYRIAPDRSEVVIDARSNVHPIHQQARGIEGHVDVEVRTDGSLDLAAPVAAELTLAVDRLAARNPLETFELRRRIDARGFPVISGQLDSFRATATAGVYLARGHVTFRGVTCPAEDEIRVTGLGDGALRIEGTHEFDIREFGMQPPRVLMMHVEPLVSVRLDVAAERAD